MEINTITESMLQNKIIIEKENKNVERNLLDKILNDIKKDTCNLRKFWKKHKNTIFWIFVTFIVLQYVDILSLGANFSDACHKQGIIQKGGQDGAPAPAAPAPAAPEAPKGNESKDKNDKDKKDKKINNY